MSPEAEVTHEMFLQCVHPEDRERVNEGVMQALGGVNGGEYACEYRIQHPGDGSQRWVTARGQAFFDSEGRPVRFIGTLMDITERKRAEQSMADLNLELERRIEQRTADLACANAALLKSEDDLRVAIDTIPSLVWISSPDGSIEYLNQRWLSYTGLALEQARDWGWQTAIHPDDLPGLMTYWKSLLAAGEAGEVEARLRRSDGVYRWFLFRGVPLYDNSGTLLKWYGTNTDIEELRASEHLSRGQMESLTRTLTALSRESEPDKFLEHVLSTIGERLGAHSIGVWEMNASTGRVQLVANFEDARLHLATNDEIQTSPQVMLAQREHPVWTEFFRSGAHCVYGEIAGGQCRIRVLDGTDTPWYDWFGAAVADPNVAPMLQRLSAAGVSSTLSVPMFIAGKVTGFLSIRFRQNRILACNEIELTRALAHQAMLAIQLMRLSRESRQAAVVAERNRMARDIHDTLAQGFTGVIMQLQAAKGAAAQGGLADASSHIERAEELARLSLGEARRSVRALRPRSLREGTLCMALADLLRQMSEGTELKTEFHVEGEQRSLSPDWEEGLLRVAQEALTNTIKHAGARMFRVRLSFETAQTRLQLVDDGNGFDLHAQHEGLGLLGMKERVAQMGGQFLLTSRPGNGTEILIILNHSVTSLPLHGNEHA